ncbi:hypothetical protein O3M35_001656 [Rhynocoris fuscipes]|uniref:NAD(+) ADP-ribosyltransferase n=1 Tax=Rhynocoris fuscipes TaxID=488301 RepID=A0AAW1CRL7_9HEMI
MSQTRYHRAAQDGLIDILKEATKRDCNVKDEDGMTPTLWAAHNGQLEALRLLVGRGGDVEKANYHFGHTALHLAALRGHLPCVTFLVGFNANLFSLDNEHHTPLQIATNPHVIDFLDKATTALLLSNKKEVKTLKEKALKDVERRKKKYDERIKKERDKEEKRMKKAEKIIGTKIEVDTPIPTVLVKNNSAVPVKGPSFTEIVGGTLSKKPTTSVKKIIEKKLRSDDKIHHSNKISPTQKKDAQIIYVSSYDNPNTGKRGRISDVFEEQASDNQVQSSIFDRPGFGSVAFRRRSNLAGTLSGPLNEVILEKETDQEGECGSETSIGSVGSLANRNKPAQPAWLADDITTSDEENIVSNGQWSPLERFLVAAGVEDYSSTLKEQQIDLDALLILSDKDLIELGIPMGPRRKLLHAVEQRKQALKNPGQLNDTKL